MVRLLNGTEGVTYRVENTIQFGSGPQQQAQRSFYVFIGRL